MEICLPKLGKKDSHNPGHVDVDVHGESHLWSVQIIDIVDLKGQRFLFQSQRARLKAYYRVLAKGYLTIIPPHRGE